jgi:hypothetical protein
MKLNLLVLIAVLLGGACAHGQEKVRFVIDTIAESRSGCSLVSLSGERKIVIEQANAQIEYPRWVELRQEGAKLPPLLTSNFVSLSNGDRLPLDPKAAAKLQAGRLQVWPAKSLPDLNAKGLDLFAPHVVLLFWSLPDGIDEAEPFFAKLQAETRKRDAVYLKNGDRIDGTITALNATDGCVLSVDGRKTQTPWSKLAGIAFNTDRQARLQTKKAYFRGAFQGGARLSLAELTFDAKTRKWTGRTQFGASLEWNEADLIAVDVRQDAAVDLAELTPARYEHRPFLGATWPLMKDAAVTGQPLRLRGHTYEKGIGVHAACQAAYRLDGKYQRFDAVVGIDDGAPKGRAKVAIDLDGKRIELNDGKEITSKTEPIVVRLDVRKVRALTLIVECGTFGDVQAHVNWAKARLVKTE